MIFLLNTIKKMSVFVDELNIKELVEKVEKNLEKKNVPGTSSEKMGKKSPSI